MLYIFYFVIFHFFKNLKDIPGYNILLCETEQSAHCAMCQLGQYNTQEYTTIQYTRLNKMHHNAVGGTIHAISHHSLIPPPSRPEAKRETGL